LPQFQAPNVTADRQGLIKNKEKIKIETQNIMSVQKSNQLSSKAIVLVHGGFVDGSGWAGVYNY
jgi:hypothetical protein